MIEFTKYAKIKDNYCLCYFGYSDEYLIQLKLIKPFLEQAFPKLNIYFGCKDDKVHLLKGCEPVLVLSRIKVDRDNYAYIREISFNGRTHPIMDLITECEITPVIINSLVPRTTNLAVLITQGAFPTKSLETSQIERLKSLAEREGFDVKLNCPIDNASLVMGVESLSLFEAASKGIRTILLPTGLGTRLYQTMFPKGEVHV